MAQRQKQGDQVGDHCNYLGERYGGLDWVIGSRSSRKQSGSEHSLQVNVIEFAVVLEVRYERKK